MTLEVFPFTLSRFCHFSTKYGLCNVNTVTLVSGSFENNYRKEILRSHNSKFLVEKIIKIFQNYSPKIWLIHNECKRLCSNDADVFFCMHIIRSRVVFNVVASLISKIQCCSSIMGTYVC